MKQILFLLMLYLSVFADELGNLLTKFNQVTQLHKDSKKEAAGHITIYTREDLDRMQAYTLNDVLNTIRIFNLQASKGGGTSLSFATAKSSMVTPIKIFINNHELNNATFGNPLAQYGDMNLYFIDYIEIYQAGNSVTFGNESGSMLVKLYTKKPEFENSTYGEITIDSEGSKQFNILDAKVIDRKYSYLLNLDINDKKMDKQKLNGYELSRDYSIGHLFFQFNKKDDYVVEIGATYGTKDTFAGFSMTPLKDEQEGQNLYLHVDKKLENDITLRGSISLEEVYLDYLDGVGIKLSDGTTIEKLKTHGETTSSSLTVEKRYNSLNNELVVALKAKQNTGRLYYFKADDKEKNMINGPTVLNIYSIYGEDLYNFDENNLLTLGLRYNYLTDNYSSEADSSFLYRVGLVSNHKSYISKIFLFNRINQPTMGQQSLSPIKIKPNADLKPAKINILSADVDYAFSEKNNLDVGVAFAKLEDAIVIDSNKKQYVNTQEKVSFKRFYVRYKQKIDLHNKFMFGFYRVYKAKSFSPARGALLQVFNKIGKVDIYNELVYRAEYTNELGKSMDAGYDYSVAITYPVSKKSTLKLKGENIFDKASEVYIYDDPDAEGIYEPARQQRFLVSWEYEF